MSVQKGDDFILKIGDGTSPTEGFLEVGGLQVTDFSLSNDLISADDLVSGRWRKMLADKARAQLEVSADGVFTDSLSEQILRNYAFAASADNYQLHFGNGYKLSGKFIISKYKRSGDMGEYEKFSITISSSEEVIYDSIS